MAKQKKAKAAGKAAGTKSAKSKKGAHGGGTPYNQMNVGKGFVTVDRRPGHSQNKNIKVDK